MQLTISNSEFPGLVSSIEGMFGVQLPTLVNDIATHIAIEPVKLVAITKEGTTLEITITP